MKRKLFVAGLAACTILATTVAAAPQSVKVEAYLTDNVILNIGGNDVEVPPEYHILNYDNRIYVPYRFVAENMGATVDYELKTGRVFIINPPPVIEKVEVVKEIAEAKTFHELPCKLRIKDVIINIYGMDNSIDTTYVYLNIENESPNSIMLDYKKAYIDIDGTKYNASQRQNEWDDSIDAYDNFEKIPLEFDKIPAKKSQITVVIPVIADEYGGGIVGMKRVPYTFNFALDVTEQQLGRESK